MIFPSYCLTQSSPAPKPDFGHRSGFHIPLNRSTGSVLVCTTPRRSCAGTPCMATCKIEGLIHLAFDAVPAVVDQQQQMHCLRSIIRIMMTTLSSYFTAASACQVVSGACLARSVQFVQISVPQTSTVKHHCPELLTGKLASLRD